MLLNSMTVIKQEDFIASVADALQYISYYHPVDYIKALGAAYAVEQSLCRLIKAGSEPVPV